MTTTNIYNNGVENWRKAAISLCGLPLPNGARNFCRQAGCPKCVSYACRARGAAFVADCVSSCPGYGPGHWQAFSVDVEDFSRWRGHIHDRIFYRRATEFGMWRDFGMIARWDGATVAGVAHVGRVGKIDLTDLLAGNDTAAYEPNGTGDPAILTGEILSRAPAQALSVSVKGIFLTIRPVCRRPTPEPKRRPLWDEPMPMLF